MNLQEFAALKAGDTIVNEMTGSQGVVSVVTKGGIRVRWPPSTMDWEFNVQSTAWMHWSKKTNDDTAPVEQTPVSGLQAGGAGLDDKADRG
jgi:hypothetical protein